MKNGKLYQSKVWLACSILFLSILMVSSVFSACTQTATISEEAPAVFQTVKPEDIGLSSQKLNEIDAVVEADIAANKINGAVLLVARHGKIAYFKNYGYRDNEKQLPMEKDSIFRLYSMTKSLTAVSVAMLKDEGKLAFDDPVAKYIPSFKDTLVGEVSIDENDEYVITTAPPRNVMTIKHLATHTSGLIGILGSKPGIAQLYAEAGMNNTSGSTTAEVSEKLAKLPLAEDPGTYYRYGMSYDVLGYLVEVVSGMTLDKFFEERIYKPLGMKDSGYLVTVADVDRLVYLNPEWSLYVDVTDPNRKYLSGASGTVSTAMDYARFAQMLFNGGEFGGKRLLKPETVAYITSDLLGPLANRNDAAYIPGRGYSVGFDFYVRVDNAGVDYPINIGEFRKDGIGGTAYSIDPEEDLMWVFMLNTTTQRMYYKTVIEKMIYQSIID